MAADGGVCRATPTAVAVGGGDNACGRASAVAAAVAEADGTASLEPSDKPFCPCCSIGEGGEGVWASCVVDGVGVGVGVMVAFGVVVDVVGLELSAGELSLARLKVSSSFIFCPRSLLRQG